MPTNDEEIAIKRRVQDQFAATANDYVQSRGHATGSDLARLVEVTRPKPTNRLLDIATGGGHVAKALGPFVTEVVLADLTPPMLIAATAFLGSSGLTNIDAVASDAELLPFADASFDIVTCRIAPHHFPHPERFIAESARLLRPGGRFALIDSTVPEGEVGAFFNRFELRRDPSHVRSLSKPEWSELISAVGLRIEIVESFRKTHDFADWTSRSKADDQAKFDLMKMMRTAEDDVQQTYQTVWDGEQLVSFADEKTLFLAHKD